MDYQIRRELFESIASDITCYFCKIVPRKGMPNFVTYFDKNFVKSNARFSGPVYYSAKGFIVCSLCRQEYGRWRHEAFYKIYLLEKLLQALPTSCRYAKNGCRIIEDSSTISQHERDCKFRDVICIFNFCDEILPALELANHLKFWHHKNFTRQDDTNVFRSEKNYLVKFIMSDGYFLNHLRWGPYVLKYSDSIIFLAHMETNPRKDSTMIWLQLFGSQFEAKNYRYRIQLQGYNEYANFP